MISSTSVLHVNFREIICYSPKIVRLRQTDFIHLGNLSCLFAERFPCTLSIVSKMECTYLITKHSRRRSLQKAYFFVSTCIASTHWLFPLTEVSASEVPAILKKLVSKKLKTFGFGGCHFETGIGIQAMFM